MRAWWILVAASCSGGGAVDTGLTITAGHLDPSFGSGGMITMDFGGQDATYGATLLASGRLLVGVATVPPNSGAPTSQLVALTTDGAIDPSFGSDGSVALDFFGGLVGVESDGSMIVGAYGELEHRFADGSLDAGYGSGGDAQATYVIGGSSVTPAAGTVSAAVDASGRVYVGAQQPDGHMLISRLTATGQADVTFGGGTIQAGFGVPENFALLADGSLLVQVGQGVHSVLLAHVLVSGTADASYAYLDGINTPHCGVAIDSSGRILVAGNSYIARFTATGALDPTFSGGTVQVPGSAGCTRLVARASGGSLLSMGVGTPPTAAVFALDDSGTRAKQYVSTAFRWADMFELPSGKLLAIGTIGTGTTQDLAIARFLP